MKKLWFGLFAFVLSVCCGFALLHGSYTRANLIAHSNAYVAYDSNYADDSPYWELIDNSDLSDFSANNTIGAYGKAYKFYVDSNALKVYVFDGTDVVSHDVTDLYGIEWEYGFDSFDFLNYYYDSSNLYFYYEGYIAVFDFVNFTFDISDDYITYCNYLIGNHFVYINRSYDGFYVDNNSYSTGDYYFDEEYFFSDGTYFYSRCGTEDVDTDLIRLSTDGTYVVYDNAGSQAKYFTDCWSDGKYAYYDNGSTHMIFDTDTHTWSNHVWTGFTGSFSRSNVWSTGTEVYLTISNTTYYLHVDRPYVSPYPNVLAELVALLTSGITGIATGIGENLSVLAESVMIDANTGNLSAFGSLVVIMAGLALALHLCRWMVNFVTSLGRRDR